MANFNWKSPFERLYGNPPSYDHLRVIGCLCYATDLKPHDKFDLRAKKGILLGYTFGYKGYKLYDLDKKTVFHSHDILFHETVFPFKQDSTSTGHSHSPSNIHTNNLFFPSYVPFPFDTSAPLSSEASPFYSSPSTGTPPISPPFFASDFVASSPSDTVPAPSSSPTDSVDSVPSSPPSSATAPLSSAPRPVLRRSSRPHHPPAWLTDYLCPQQKPLPLPSSSSQSTSFTCVTPYPLFSFVNLAHLSSTYMASLHKVLHT